jgi:hypothetical protein
VVVLSSARDNNSFPDQLSQNKESAVKRIALISRPMLSLCVLVGASFQLAAQDNKPRRPLPKPPTGSRGFEQGNRDASSRLIAAGATRGPLKPIAPAEGLAYDARPFFAWAPSPGAASYHFTLRCGADSTSAIVYETDVECCATFLSADAPALTPGQLYSWRVSTAGLPGTEAGTNRDVLCAGRRRRAQLRAALEKAKVTAPKTGR